MCHTIVVKRKHGHYEHRIQRAHATQRTWHSTRVTVPLSGLGAEGRELPASEWSAWLDNGVLDPCVSWGMCVPTLSAWCSLPGPGVPGREPGRLSGLGVVGRDRRLVWLGCRSRLVPMQFGSSARFCRVSAAGPGVLTGVLERELSLLSGLGVPGRERAAVTSSTGRCWCDWALLRVVGVESVGVGLPACMRERYSLAGAVWVVGVALKVFVRSASGEDGCSCISAIFGPEKAARDTRSIYLTPYKLMGA